MSELVFSVADEVFARFPGYARGVVLAYGVTNSESPPELAALLRAAEDSVRQRLSPEGVAAHPRIACWRGAYASFGAKPAKFRSSIEAMVRRALRDEELPSISALVDVGNVVSLRHMVPAGGHALDVVTHDIVLRPATGEEEFTAFGSDEMEHPEAGEIIFAEGNVVLTRRWTWRQANHTLIRPSTTAVEYNVDGLPPVPVSEVGEICLELIGLIGRFCGGRARHEILTREYPRTSLSAPQNLNGSALP
jgi:DNA/RNA-binding domain of Phe-tRNA-synthetase-like protein